MNKQLQIYVNRRRMNKDMICNNINISRKMNQYKSKVFVSTDIKLILI